MLGGCKIYYRPVDGFGGFHQLQKADEPGVFIEYADEDGKLCKVLTVDKKIMIVPRVYVKARRTK